MKREVQAQDFEFETVLMRRFHLTPGQPEYVVVKRRLTPDDAERRRVERERSAQKPERKAAPTESVYKRQGLTTRASGTVNAKEGGRPSGTGRGKQVKKASGHKAGKMRRRNRSAA